MGAGGVGKSCVTVRLVQDVFVDGMDPTIEDSYQKHMEVDGTSTRLDILDTAGQEDYVTMRDQYFRECQGFVFVYAINSETSFAEIDELLSGLVAVKEKDPYAVTVLGNKCDLEQERKIVKSAAEDQIGKSCDGKSSFFECSAKTGTNIKEAFDQLVKDLRKTPWTAPCQCSGKCQCLERCVICGKQFNQHTDQNSDHPFKKAGGVGRFCTIL